MLKLLPLLLLFASCVPAHYTPCPGPVTKIPGDTIHEQMLVTIRPMGFAVARYGLAIVRDGACQAHMYCDGRHIKAPVVVWMCETEMKNKCKKL